jgi:hypothetical protein
MPTETEIIPVFIPGQIIRCKYIPEEIRRLSSPGYRPNCFFGITESVSRANKAILLGCEIENFDGGCFGQGYAVNPEYDEERKHHATLDFDRRNQQYFLLDKENRLIQVEPIFDFHEIETEARAGNEGGIVELLRQLTARLS